jgi:DNA-binding MarR family transcriptional regulator
LPANLTELNLWGTGYCASLNFRRTARAVTRMYDSAMQASGVRSTQFALLVGIAKAQPVSMSKLAGVLGLDRTTMTRSLRLLQKEKMITISRRAAMRQRFLELTPAGEKALARSLPLWRKVQEQFVSAVGADYWTKLRSELEGLARTTMTMGSPEETALITKPDRNANSSGNAKN